MGTYDNFLSDDEKICVQLKIGECLLKDYKAGDEVNISNGIYMGYEGVVVIKDRKVVGVFGEGQVFDKWGGPFDFNDAINELNPLKQVLEDEAEKYKK